MRILGHILYAAGITTIVTWALCAYLSWASLTMGISSSAIAVNVLLLPFIGWVAAIAAHFAMVVVSHAADGALGVFGRLVPALAPQPTEYPGNPTLAPEQVAARIPR